MNLGKAASVFPLLIGLKQLKSSCPAQLVEFALSQRVIKPLQVNSEFHRFAEVVARLKPKYLLEIGTCFGGTLFVLSRLAAQGATIISVDLPGGKFGGGYSSLRTPIYRRFPRKDEELYLIRGNSHGLETQNRVKDILGNNQLDLLFTDGDHSYQGVKEDFEGYRHFVRKGGLIAFHDIAEHRTETGCEVSRFWNEVKQQYAHEEIIENPKQGWAGIGIVTV